jgi:hypothetical protein
MRVKRRLLDLLAVVLLGAFLWAPTVEGRGAPTCEVECGWGSAQEVGSYAFEDCEPDKCFWTRCELTNSECLSGGDTGRAFTMGECGNAPPCQEPI